MWHNTQHVALVNETFVKKFFAHTNPLGHILHGNMAKSTIVGVVRDSKYTSVDEKPAAHGLLRHDAGAIAGHYAH